MDRNAVENINLSYEEVIASLSAQIGELTTELIVTKTMLKKAQDLLSVSSETDKKKSEDLKS